MSEPSDSLREQFGDIDVYLFDQLLRGRIVSGMKVLAPATLQRGYIRTLSKRAAARNQIRMVATPSQFNKPSVSVSVRSDCRERDIGSKRG